MWTAAVRAFAILTERKCWGVVRRGVLITAGVFVLLGAGVWWILAEVTVFEIGWLDKTLDVLGGLAVLVLTWLLFPAVSTLVITLLLEKIFVAVESRHYPGLPAPRAQPLAEYFAIAVRLTAVLVLFNLLALPLYLIPGLGPVVTYLINAHLLGREYFELAAIRRLDAGAVHRVRKGNRARIAGAGLLIALLFTVPVLNLLAPVVSAAFMLHVFQGLSARKESGSEFFIR